MKKILEAKHYKTLLYQNPEPVNNPWALTLRDVFVFIHSGHF
jgi:hypothetical protein